MPWWNRKRNFEGQLDTELGFHIEQQTDANIAAGHSPQEARRLAMLDFGGREQMKEELRDVHRLPIIETALANLRIAFRQIRKSPSFSITVILTLALGIGANSAVFSAIDAVLLRPLPFPQSDRLMRVHQYNYKNKNPENNVAPARLEDWNRMNSTFEAMTGYYSQDLSEISGALPEKVKVASVGPRFHQVWEISPELGRDFNSKELELNGPGAVLISDAFWRRRFGGDPDALGKNLRIGERSYSIVGVMPASFLFPIREVDIWSPVPAGTAAQFRDATWYNVVGRLKPGVTASQAQANLAAVQADLGRAYPKSDANLAVGIQPLKEVVVSGAGTSLWLMYGSVSLLLLIACTNIAALLLARGTQRRQEISIRFSLGASRLSVVLQMLTEIFVLAVAGTLLGLIVAGASSGVFRSLAGDFPRIEEMRLDGRIVLYSLSCAVLTTLLSGLYPAFRGTRRSLSAGMLKGGRTQVSAHNPMQWLLVGVQVALAVTLLTGAGLLIRSFQELGRVTPGFEPSHVLTLHISGSYVETNDMKVLTQRIDQTIEFLKAIPGVENAATSPMLPGVPNSYEGELKVIEGRADTEPKVIAETRFVSPSYFATLQVPVLAGEICREDPVSVVVNRSFARAYFTGQTPLGYHLQPPSPTSLPPGEIHGVVGDVREKGLGAEPVPTVYWCSSSASPDPNYLIRTHGEPMAMAETIRRKIHDIEPARAVSGIVPLEYHLSNSFADNRLRTVLLSFFALTAVLLACIGLYGTLSYFVNVRRREVGLRLALGALRGQIVQHFMSQGLVVSLFGCIAGLSLAAALARAISGMLYGVSASDAVTLSVVVGTILVVAAMASLLPAMRASRVDPMQVLRDE